jgi:dUTPase
MSNCCKGKKNNNGFIAIDRLAQFANMDWKTVVEISDDLPVRSTSKSVGYDLVSTEDVVISKGEIKTIGTGVTAYIDEGYELQIRSRSGLAKNGVIVVNSPGTIDPDYYPNEIGVILTSLVSDYKVTKGNKIAQGVFSPVGFCNDIYDKKFTKDKVRDSGFGSTGK